MILALAAFLFMFWPMDQQNLSDLPSEKFIRRGYLADIRDFPHHAYLIMMIQLEHWYSGGSLIDPHWVVTAAHIIHDWGTPTGIKVRLGIDDRNDDGFIANVDLYICHPAYQYFDDKAPSNDICLFRMIKAAPESDRIKLIALPEKNEEDYFRDNKLELKVSGFGDTNNILDPDLVYTPDPWEGVKLRGLRRQKAENISRCRRFANKDPLPLCTFADNNNQPCAGDSGGGLFGKRKDGKHVILGIVSYGACGWWTLYTRVSDYLEWIGGTMLNNTRTYY